MCSILVVLQSDLPLSVKKRSVDDYFGLAVFFQVKDFKIGSNSINHPSNFV